MGRGAADGTWQVSRNTVLLFSALGLLVLKIVFWFYQFPILGHDQYSLLWEAGRLLSGASLYGSQVAEPNPPLIIWFSAIAVFLGRLLHVTETTAFLCLVLSMVLVSVYWSARSTRGHRAFVDLRVRLLLAFAILVIEAPMRILMYGQREDLLVICVLPYMVAVALDRMAALPVYERIAMGMMAACGVCLKPHQVLVIVGIELVLLLFHRSLRHLLSIEFIATVLTCMLYVGAIRVFTPQYLSTTLPILRDTYWALGSHSIGFLALHQVPEMAGALAILCALFLILKDQSDRKAVLCFVSAALFASLAYDIQRTTWGYHLLPVIAFLAMAASMLVFLRWGGLVARFDASYGAATSAAMIAAAAAVLLAFVYVEHRTKPVDELPHDGGAFDGLTPKDAVYVFSTGAELFPAAYRRNLQWGSRYPVLWMLPALARNLPGGRAEGWKDLPFKALSPTRAAELSTIQQTAIAEDLDRWKPKVVLMEQCPCDFIYNDRFDMLAWFKQNAQFRQAWSHYAKTNDISGFAIYRRMD